MSNITCLRCLTVFCVQRGVTGFGFPRMTPVPPHTQCTLCSTDRRGRRVFFDLPCSLPDFYLQQPRNFKFRVRFPRGRQQPPSPPPTAQPTTTHTEKRRRTYELEEDCPTCFEQDKAGHRMCLRCNCSCCNACWIRMDKCPLCRCSKN